MPDELPSLSNIQNGVATDTDIAGDKLCDFTRKPDLQIVHGLVWQWSVC